MSTSVQHVRTVVQSIADTALKNEQYFSDLDAVAGDGDFGYSLARGFESVLEQWDSLDDTDPSAFLRGVSMTLTSRLGGTSGPIWGTGFLRAAVAVQGRTELRLEDVLAMMDAAIAGIQKRGGAAIGDKTLLDALWPLRDELEAATKRMDQSADVAAAVAAAARRGATHTKDIKASRGRAAYVGDRSIGFEDPGAVAIALMAEHIAALWQTRSAAEGPITKNQEPGK
jgi:dihydroxyacetone kinase-like protein